MVLFSKKEPFLAYQRPAASAANRPNAPSITPVTAPPPAREAGESGEADESRDPIRLDLAVLGSPEPDGDLGRQDRDAALDRPIPHRALHGGADADLHGARGVDQAFVDGVVEG